jgi:hypothetical protein
MSEALIGTQGTSSATPEMRASVAATPGTPVLFDTVWANGPDGIRFDLWYSNERTPEVAASAAVSTTRRYGAPSRNAYLVIGELDGAPIVSPATRAAGTLPASVARVERFVGRPLGAQRRRDASKRVADAPIVYPVFFRVPRAREAEFDRWYDEEHLPMLLTCPHWVMCRRFRIEAGADVQWTHVALHYLIDLRALQSPERDAARSTRWRRQLEAEPWFQPEYRVFYRLRESVNG